jgi:acetate kinase
MALCRTLSAIRSGSVDPGLVIWLQRHGGLSLDEVSDRLEFRAGLAGLADLPGGSGNMRDVRRAADRDDPQARLAIDVHTHRPRREIAAIAAALDASTSWCSPVGSASISRWSAPRPRTGFLGVAVDEVRNDTAQPDCDISVPDAAVRTLVIAAREDVEIASQTRAVLTGERPGTD